MRRLIKLTLVVCGVAALTGYQAIERFPEYLGPLVALTSTETVRGRVTHIRDGDTIEVDGIPIRFGSLDCAERGSRAGDKATLAITQIVAEAYLTCHLNGRSSYDRRIGSCQLTDGSNVGGLMITGGHCSRYW